jgi:hypothetical protein
MRVLFMLVGMVFGMGLSACATSVASTQPVVPASGLVVRLSLVEEGRIYMKRKEWPALRVVFENTSTQPLGVIDEWNSMGWFNLKFKYTMSDGIPRVMERKYGAWLRNYLTVTKLRPGEVLVRDIYFEDDGWEGVPTVTQNTPVTIQAVFIQDGTSGIDRRPDAAELDRQKAAGVWIGQVESASLRTTLWVQ